MRRARRTTLVLVALLTGGCLAPGAPPTRPALRDARIAPMVPDAAELAAADLAAAALVGDPSGTSAALLGIEALDKTRSQGPTGLAPVGTDLLNAAAAPGRAYRARADDLLDRDDLGPALRERIERELDDDPLVQATARIWDARLTTAARLFNAVVEPVGMSMLDTSQAPYRLGRSLLNYGLKWYREDSLPLQRRQALAYWKRFLARYPDAPEAPEIEEDAEKAQVRWHKTRRHKALRLAKAALRAGDPRQALVLAERALQHSPEHEGAEKVRAEAEQLLLAQRANQRRSVGFALAEGRELLPEGTRESAIALLVDAPPPVSAASLPEAPDSEPRFAYAGQLARSGLEQAGWDELREIAEADPDEDPMVRHAQAALADPVRNPYDTFVRARWRDRRTRAGWVVLGPYAEAPTPKDTVGVLQTMVELPRMAQVAFTLPIRLIQLPFAEPPKTSKVTAVQARRYLRIAENGEHAEEVADWLESYERDRGNHLGELRIAEARHPETDHTELREQAARQTLRVALREQRMDMRQSLLKGVTRAFPETVAGKQAGRLARDEREDYTPHHIAISRGFLEENPEVAGVQGLDLDPALLDGNPSNGELHPRGLALVGERVIELSFVAASGDEEDAPEIQQTRVSPDRLARLVARLEETSFRNALLDAGDPVRPDAQRDNVFERVRLGLADEVDPRATARAGFTYRGMRERYGVVRRREPILPFDLVVKGSLDDLSLGAFPRMREPKPTPDAILYE